MEMWWGEHLSSGGVSIPLYGVFPAKKHGRTNYRLKKGTSCALGFEVCERRRYCLKTALCSQRTSQELKPPVVEKRVQRHA